ncbi:MAG: ATP-dependent helicase HrpB [Ahrensia sp.]|nr:ATP-dependent helicase HrpB [Ahrensia sp.]
MVDATSQNARPDLPIDEVLPEILRSLRDEPNLVLVAPPGAGKTTVLPLALLNAPWRGDRKIIVLEPRRLAARAAAERMADLLGETVGQTVGYRVRFDTKVSDKTRIEVVTQGVFTRMLAADMGLDGVAAVLFDEFHERSLDSDMSLALCLDLQSALRDDLRLIAMSATLDGAAIAELMSARVIESQGRSFPVEIVHEPRKADQRIEPAIIDAVLHHRETHGDMLVFLPGQGEIEHCAERLGERLGDRFAVHRLYAAVSQAAQNAAIRPDPDGRRKVVFASAIAETSLTIDGVTTVIDSGLARQPLFEPATGFTRLRTQRASRASITQRAGRAGRTAPGRAIRLWHEGQTAALPDRPPPEIANADLSSLLLNLAEWGVCDPNALRWLDPPSAPALNEARNLLLALGALDDAGAITAHGRALHALPLPPRLAHMVVRAAKFGRVCMQRAALLGLLVQEHGAGGPSVDLETRRKQLERSKRPRDKALIVAATRMAKVSSQSEDSELSDGALLALAFPDRVAKRSGATRDEMQRYRMANGSGAQIEIEDALSREDWLVIVDMSGRAGASRATAAAALSKEELLDLLGERIQQKTDILFDKASGTLQASRSQMLGQIELFRPEPIALDDETALAGLLDALRDHGLDLLPWRDEDRSLRQRLALLHSVLGSPWPDVSDKNLTATLEDWLAPFLAGKRSLTVLPSGTVGNALMLFAGHPPKAQLEKLVPSYFETPSGSRLPIRYQTGQAILAVRPQELFGLDHHPSILEGQLPVTFELLSPAGRPIQLTQDLPGFWRGSWADVRADLRGRYPKHPWPDDPLAAEPTSRAKPRSR